MKAHSWLAALPPSGRRPPGLSGLLSRVALVLLFLASLLAAETGQAAAVEQAPFSGHWIDVNLATLTATAYDGARAVHTAPVTSGKKGYETPTGTFRILSRVRVTDMQSSPGAREPYYVKNVQYVQYFKSGGFAIHANYWASSSVFGRANSSHGCVSMRANHAAYFWNFATIGTPIYIHYSQPKVSVANVIGKSQSPAKSQLQSVGLKVAVSQRVTVLSSPGTVLSQKPGGGASATKGSTVTLVVAAEPKQAPESWSMGSPYPPVLPYGDPSATTIWAPTVVGLSESFAITRIQQAGLRVSYVESVDEATAPASMRAAVKAAKRGTVVAGSATPGSVLKRGSGYMIIVKRK